MYQTVQPLLKDLAPALEGRATKTLKGAASGYEYLRDKDAAVDAAGGQIETNLKRKGLSHSEKMPY